MHILIIVLGLLSSLPSASSSSSSSTRKATTKATVSTTTTPKEQLQLYYLQQQLQLQSRSQQLRKALVDRGLDGFRDNAGSTEAVWEKFQIVDWDCALATAQHPKTCKFSFGAEPGTKVVGPIDEEEWITLAALNRLRRTDPTKVEGMWHDKYAIHKSWFHSNAPFPLYSHMPFSSVFLSLLLDSPALLGLVLIAAVAGGIILAMPLLYQGANLLLKTPYLWNNWRQWGPLVHAALPLKLLIIQFFWNAFVVGLGGTIYSTVRKALIEKECQLLEEHIPLTIIEGEEEEEEDEEEDV